MIFSGGSSTNGGVIEDIASPNIKARAFSDNISDWFGIGPLVIAFFVCPVSLGATSGWVDHRTDGNFSTGWKIWDSNGVAIIFAKRVHASYAAINLKLIGSSELRFICIAIITNLNFISWIVYFSSIVSISGRVVAAINIKIKFDFFGLTGVDDMMAGIGVDFFCLVCRRSNLGGVVVVVRDVGLSDIRIVSISGSWIASGIVIIAGIVAGFTITRGTSTLFSAAALAITWMWLTFIRFFNTLTGGSSTVW